MAHLLDFSRGYAAIAFAGETPWHGFGRQLTPDASIETWTREAGLDYTVEEAPVLFQRGLDIHAFNGRRVLYRGDTMQPLSVVGPDYKVVQPSAIMDVFRALTKHASFQMECAGALDDGKRIWALAKINDGACLLDADNVIPYVLFATSYDGTLSTVGKLTTIRVVCNNTLTASVGGGENARFGQSERDVPGQIVRVPHSAYFDPEQARLDLGIVFDGWERFLATARRLARTTVDEKFATEFLKTLLPTPVVTDDNGKKVPGPVENSRPYKSIMALFNGAADGADLPEANGTAWGLLNAVTQFVDHERGGDKTRLASAWFGTGAGLKDKARDLLVEVTA